MHKIMHKSNLSFLHSKVINYLKCINPSRNFHFTQNAKAPSLVVTPLVCAFDKRPVIRVEGLRPQQSVTLKAQMKEDKGKLLYSNAHYVADDNGLVDVAVSPSLNGTYTGVFPTGLLSSLKIASGNFEFGSINKFDIYEPIKLKISVLNGHKPIETDEDELDSVELERHMVGKGVQRIPVREGRVRGVLYIPEGEGPFPGVIDMFGATGVLFESRAAMNATRGIASLALAYFSYDDLPVEHIHNIDLTYLEEAIEYLLSHHKVKSDRCGVVGNCFGGYLAYQASLCFNKLKAIFIINAPRNPFFSDLKYKGKVVAPLKYNIDHIEDFIRKDSEGIYTPIEEYNRALSEVNDCHIAAFNNTLDDQHFAVAIGDHDCYQFHNGWQKFAQLLNEEKRKNFSLKIYPRAGHIIHPPYSMFSPIAFGQLWGPTPVYQNRYLLKLGGETQETVTMQEDVYQWMFDFFQKHLGEGHNIK